jgi:hypothetical protein
LWYNQRKVVVLLNEAVRRVDIYRVIDNLRMTVLQAVERYLSSLIVIRLDNMGGDTGAVICIGDDDDDILEFFSTLDDDSDCLVTEDRNLLCCLGGVVVGA